MIALPLALLAIAAPRTPYGGELIAYVFGRAPAADATLQRAVYEPLYSVDDSGQLIPNLAADLPAIEGNRLTIHIRPNLVAHDGTLVTAPRVVEWLTRIVAKDAPGSFIGISIARIASIDELSFTIELAHAHPEFARLLASRHAGVGVGNGAGTGPFRSVTSDKGAVILTPFLEHFVGRPYLDRIELRPLASRFGTSSIAKKEQAALVFETPDAAQLRWPERSQKEVLVLSIGDRLAKQRASLADAIDRAVNRRRLTGRYLDGAVPAFSFLDGPREPGPPSAIAPTLEASLLVAKEARAGQRFAERVQLDLHRAGVIVKIERVSAEAIEKARKSGDYQLLLDVALPDGPNTERSIDRLHALLSIASSYGRADFAGDPVQRFFIAKEELRGPLLIEIEAALRSEVGLVPLAWRAPAIFARDDLGNLTITADGSIDLADVFLKGTAR
jgi:MarR-like DNA-binding transcriptional regulator SgrR of sgrS sRNA